MFRKSLAVIAVAIVVAFGAAVSRVHAVEQWALYTSSGPGHPLRLFLEPFPAKTYCQYDADQVVRNGGRAECRSRMSYTLDSRPANTLAWTFITEWSALCGT